MRSNFFFGISKILKGLWKPYYYYVWHYPVNGRKPRLAKEVKLYSQTITQLNEDGEKYRIAIQDFDDLEFC